MERVMERNKLMLVFVWRNRFAHFARELNGSLVGLRATVAYECAGCASKSSGCMGELDKLFREKTCVWVVIKIRSMNQLFSLHQCQLISSIR